jgi:hypothetical protein
MIAIQTFRDPEFRERLTEVILEVLAQLPETHRNIFVWNRYRGYQPGHLAEMLGWSSAEVEATLGEIQLILCRRTRALLAADPKTGEKQVDLRVSQRKAHGRCVLCDGFASLTSRSPCRNKPKSASAAGLTGTHRCC